LFHALGRGPAALTPNPLAVRTGTGESGSISPESILKDSIT
jgi:hypothetical protein